MPRLDLQGRSQPKFRLDAGRNAGQFLAEMQVRSQPKFRVDPARNVWQILAEMRGGSWPKRGGSWAGGPAAVQPRVPESAESHGRAECETPQSNCETPQYIGGWLLKLRAEVADGGMLKII